MSSIVRRRIPAFANHSPRFRDLLRAQFCASHGLPTPPSLPRCRTASGSLTAPTRIVPRTPSSTTTVVLPSAPVTSVTTVTTVTTMTMDGTDADISLIDLASLAAPVDFSNPFMVAAAADLSLLNVRMPIFINKHPDFVVTKNINDLLNMRWNSRPDVVKVLISQFLNQA